MARPGGHPFAGGEWGSAYRLGRGPDYEAYADSLLFDPAPAGGGTTHLVTAAVMAFAGQGVVSQAATVHGVSLASMTLSGQSAGSVNATVHAVAAATIAYAGQAVASIAATVHAVGSAVKTMLGQLVQSATPTSHAVDAASEIYAGNAIDGGGAGDAGTPTGHARYGKRFGFRGH